MVNMFMFVQLLVQMSFPSYHNKETLNIKHLILRYKTYDIRF